MKECWALKSTDPQYTCRNRSGSAWKRWTEADPMILAHRLASGPDLFGPNRTQSARNKSDPAGFAQYDPGRLWRNTTESKSRETGGGPVASCQKPGPMIFAHWLNCFWTRRHSDRIRAGFAQHDPGFLCRKNGTESDAGSQIRHNYTIRPDSGCTLTVMAITGLSRYNQNASESDLACLLGRPFRDWRDGGRSGTRAMSSS